MAELAMGDEARKRIGITPQKEAIDAGLGVNADPKFHFHIWIEKGWSGTTSPAYPTIRAAGEALKRLASEPWCKGFSGSDYFPFEQVFLLHADGHSLNATIRSCSGKGIPSSTYPCNPEATWR